MADSMEDLKLTVNEDFAKKFHKQKQRAELDQCKYWKFKACYQGAVLGT